MNSIFTRFNFAYYHKKHSRKWNLDAPMALNSKLITLLSAWVVWVWNFNSEISNVECLLLNRRSQPLAMNVITVVTANKCTHTVWRVWLWWPLWCHSFHSFLFAKRARSPGAMFFFCAWGTVTSSFVCFFSDVLLWVMIRIECSLMVGCLLRLD